VAFTSAVLASSSGRCWAGNEKFAVRWKTVSSDAWPAMTGIAWMPWAPTFCSGTAGPSPRVDRAGTAVPTAVPYAQPW
jgi:hypothetical protein